MLIATRDMSCLGQKVRAGQPIPTPNKWNPSALQSNINLGWVREATKEEIEHLTAPPSVDKADEQPPPSPRSVGAGPNDKPEGFDCEKCARSFKTKGARTLHARSHKSD